MEFLRLTRRNAKIEKKDIIAKVENMKRKFNDSQSVKFSVEVTNHPNFSK